LTTTSTLITFLAVMIVVNIALAMLQGAVSEINPSISFFDVEDSPYAKYVQNETLIVDDSYFPDSEETEADTSGNIFTDTYKSAKSWLQAKLAPLNFVSNILKQPYGFLGDIGVPHAIALGFGVLWYLIALLLLVSWLMGR